MAKDYDDIGGVWRTIGGRRVFIKTGQSLSEAMKESGKFKNAKKQETEEEKSKKMNETMDKRASIINKLDEDTKDLEDYDKYNLAVSKLEQTEGMQPTERQYWAGVKERYEKQEKARDHTFKMNDEEKKKYEDVGKKIDDLTKEIGEAKELSGEEISQRVKANKIVDSYGNNVVYQTENGNYITSRQNYNDYVNGKKDKLGGELVLNEKEARDRLASYDADEKYPYEGYVADEKTGNAEKAKKLKQENLDKMYKSIGYDDSKYNYGLEQKTTDWEDQIENYNDKATAKFGKIDYYGNGRKLNEVQIEMELKNGTFSAMGFIKNASGTDSISGGQNIDEIADLMKDNKDVQEIHELWQKYHLNDMHAGTEKQERILEKYKSERKAIAEEMNKGKTYDWEKVSENDYYVTKKLLENHNLYEDNGYKYGSGWLKREIPVEDKKRIIRLIDKYNGKTSDNQINNTLRQKAYQKYLKEHPGSKMTFEEFKK